MYIKKRAHAHLAAFTLTPAILFTCCERCERSSKLETVSCLKNCASCKFWDLFWNYRQVFTGLVHIAGYVALLALQVTMLSKPI